MADEPFVFDWINKEEWLEDKTWWQIYLHSFPKNERDTRDQIYQAAADNIACLGRFKKNHKTQAIAVIYPLKNVPITYLHYFAVEKSLRGAGIGLQLLNNLIDKAYALNFAWHGKCWGLIWEVEDPLHATTTEEKTVRDKRICFYQKVGAVQLKKPFIQPPIDSDDENEFANGLGMQLMATSLHQAQDYHCVEWELAHSIYQEKYHRVNNTPQKIMMNYLDICHHKTAL